MKLRSLIITTLCISLISGSSNSFAGNLSAETQCATTSPTEGVITHDFVPENEMKQDMMQMLADFTGYMINNYKPLPDTNSAGEEMISFTGENTFGNNEQGVRHNADMSMICAALVKYGKGNVMLPDGVTWELIEDLARKSLVYSYSTHTANRLYPCKDGNFWGSDGNHGQWESSLWAMSVAYSAFFQWESLSDEQKNHIKSLLESECDYELNRDIPSGFKGDTKAEENGWEADVLAAALGLFPDHEKAPAWFDRLREFAINSYSHPSDSVNREVIDPEYDNKAVADLFKGANLYNDWTLQNHDLFHTSYQNVVMQELGEAALALKLFQNGIYGSEKWKTNALMHNNREVMENVLNRLALADGELAMPNGNDWSLFLFDQITSYSTMACFLKDPTALFLENMAYKNIKARQSTTSDGSWLLRADVGSRRMGVEAHRVLMSWLMHHVLPTSDVTPATWNEIMNRYGETFIFPDQNIIRSSSPYRFTTFSWSDGLKSYTGYLTSQNPDNNKIIVPYRANNTGNFIGWYDVEGCKKNAVPVVNGKYIIDRNSFVMNGELLTNDSTLDHRFAIYSTPGNAVIYIDYVTALKDVVINKTKGGLMAISMDEFTKTHRNIYSESTPEGFISDGNGLNVFKGDWLNIDNTLGFVMPSNSQIAFGDKGNNNSILTSKIYTLYSDAQRDVTKGDSIDRRSIIYYTDVDADATKSLRDKCQNLSWSTPEGWNGVLAADTDSSYYIIVSNFDGKESGFVNGLSTEYGAPVLSGTSTIRENTTSAELSLEKNSSFSEQISVFIKDADLIAIKDGNTLKLTNRTKKTIKPTITILTNHTSKTQTPKIKPNQTLQLTL